jgi:lipopolysaccharide biosynthesis glycosyltransferase
MRHKSPDSGCFYAGIAFLTEQMAVMKTKTKKGLVSILCVFCPARFLRQKVRRHFLTNRKEAYDLLPVAENQRISVAFCFDKNLVKQAAVAIRSLLSTADGKCAYDIYCVVDKDVSNKDKSVLKKISAAFCGSSLTFLEPNGDFGGAWLGSWPLAAYFRLMLPKLLPDVEKIIYTDLDMVFCNGLQGAWRIDLKDNYIAGASDNGGSREDVSSGFLIMNLKQMRDDGIYEKLIGYSKTPGLRCPDQEVVNRVCEGRILRLPSKYNLPLKVFLYICGNDMACQKKMIRDLVIVHCFSKRKPWLTGPTSLPAELWWRHARQTGLF